MTLFIQVLVVLSMHRLTSMAADQCKQDTLQESLQDRQLMNHVFTTFELVPDIEICHEACDFMKDCYSANFIQKRKVCEINNATHLSTTNKQNFIVNNSSVFFMQRMDIGKIYVIICTY